MWCAGLCDGRVISKGGRGTDGGLAWDEERWAWYWQRWTWYRRGTGVVLATVDVVLAKVDVVLTWYWRGTGKGGRGTGEGGRGTAVVLAKYRKRWAWDRRELLWHRRCIDKRPDARFAG